MLLSTISLEESDGVAPYAGVLWHRKLGCMFLLLPVLCALALTGTVGLCKRHAACRALASRAGLYVSAVPLFLRPCGTVGKCEDHIGQVLVHCTAARSVPSPSPDFAHTCLLQGAAAVPLLKAVCAPLL